MNSVFLNNSFFKKLINYLNSITYSVFPNNLFLNSITKWDIKNKFKNIMSLKVTNNIVKYLGFSMYDYVNFGVSFWFIFIKSKQNSSKNIGLNMWTPLTVTLTRSCINLHILWIYFIYIYIVYKRYSMCNVTQ